jgi:hypothetical protein
MKSYDVAQIIADCDIIKEYIERCQKQHRKIDPLFIFNKGKSVMDYAYQCHCLSQKRIPVCGVYEL